MNLSLSALLEHDDTRSTTIRFVCALRKTLSGAPATQQSLEWGLEVERLHRGLSKEDLVKAYSDVRYGNRLTKNEATTKPEPPRKPPVIVETKPVAIPMSTEQAIKYLRSALTALKEAHKEDPIEVKYEAWCEFVAKKHLNNNTKCWDISDTQLLSGTKGLRWKNTVSQALQKLKDEDLISLRKKPERWHVFRD